MSISIAGTNKVVLLDTGEFERQILSLATSNGITTQAAWDNLINNLTQGQSLLAMQALLRSLKISTL